MNNPKPSKPMLPANRQSSRVDIVRSLKTHPRLACMMLVLALVLGLPASLWKGRRTYHAEAVIYISPRFVSNLEDNKEFELQSNSQYREFVQQNARTVNRFDIVTEALKRLGPGRHVWQRDAETERKAVERLQGALKIRAIPETYQIAVGLESEKAEGLADIVNSVVETYVEKSHEEEFYGSDQRLKNLTAERQRLLKEIERASEEKTRISQGLGVSSFGEGYPNPYDRLLVDSKGILAGATQRRIQSESELASLEQADSAAAFAQEMAAKDAALTSLAANLNTRRSELLKAVAGLAANHPGRRAAETEIEQISKVLQGDRDSLTQRYTALLLQQRRAELLAARGTEAKLRKELEGQAAQASWYSRNFQHAVALSSDIEHDRKRLEAVENRISFLMLESTAPGFARVFSHALPAETPVGGGRRKIMAFFFALGIALSIAAPVGADWIDPRIHDGEDMERVLGFGPLATLSAHGIMDRHEYRNELKRLAAAIEREVLLRGSKRFVFTCLEPRKWSDGLLHEVAGELKSLGLRTLIVEVNTISYISDGCQVTKPADGRDVLSLCPELEDSELALIPRLREALDGQADRYEVVLIDAPPIRMRAESESLLQLADVAVLVAQAKKSEIEELRQAAKILERCEPKAVACVLTAAPAKIEAKHFSMVAARPIWLSPWLWS